MSGYRAARLAEFDDEPRELSYDTENEFQHADVLSESDVDRFKNDSFLPRKAELDEVEVKRDDRDLESPVKEREPSRNSNYMLEEQPIARSPYPEETVTRAPYPEEYHEAPAAVAPKAPYPEHHEDILPRHHHDRSLVEHQNENFDRDAVKKLRIEDIYCPKSADETVKNDMDREKPVVGQKRVSDLIAKFNSGKAYEEKQAAAHANGNYKSDYGVGKAGRLQTGPFK